jgi:hypothetical protein
LRARRNKYGATKTTIDGITFDSKKEAQRYCELRLLQKAGEITHLELQPAFRLAIDGRPVLIKSHGYPILGWRKARSRGRQGISHRRVQAQARNC